MTACFLHQSFTLLHTQLTATTVEPFPVPTFFQHTLHRQDAEPNGPDADSNEADADANEADAYPDARNASSFGYTYPD